MQVSSSNNFIAYGTDTTKSRLTKVDDKVRTWYFEKGVIENNYYLVVGRFVPENNYEAMIRGFMASNSTRTLFSLPMLKKTNSTTSCVRKLVLTRILV
ncbi:MAG: hypothetical protein ACLS5G_00930 [Streptococcus sp.]